MEPFSGQHPIDIEKYKLIRERWDKEDELLLARTGVFLTANSILCAALGFQSQNQIFQIGVAFVGLILSILWLLTSLQSYRIIGKLFFLCKDVIPHGLMEIYKIKRFLGVRPTSVFCKWIPGLIITGWLVFIIWSLSLAFQ